MYIKNVGYIVSYLVSYSGEPECAIETWYIEIPVNE